MKVAPCRSCQRQAVSSAAICLHCGTPNPVSIGRGGNAAALFAGLLAVVVIVAFLFFVL